MKTTQKITLLDDVDYEMTSAPLSAQLDHMDLQDQIMHEIPGALEEERKKLFEYDDEGNVTKRKELSSEKKQEIRSTIRTLTKKQLEKGAEICATAFKKHPEVNVEFLMDNADMTHYSTMLTFVLGGKPAVAELFRGIKITDD